jgi:hypothetical protein
MDKFGATQKRLRTAATTTLKVGSSCDTKPL